MTKAIGKGRGGARPGAGRPRKIKPEATAVAPPKASGNGTVPVAKATPAIDITSEAQKAALKGVKRVAGIAQHGSAMEVIKATEMLLRWGFVKPEVAKAAAAADRYQATPAPAEEKPAETKAPELGKKEIRKLNAAAATESGIYAVPTAPKMVVNNG